MDFDSESRTTLDLLPEEAKALTPLRFNEEQWKRFFSDNRPYKPDQVFFGDPAKPSNEGGLLFRNVYGPDGKHLGGAIAGQPQPQSAENKRS